MTQPNAFVATVDTVDVSCYQAADGSLSANVQGGSGSYAYNWSNGGGTASINNLSGGNYSLTISDGSCPNLIINTLTVEEPTLFSVDIDTVPISCYQLADGELIALATGGSGLYSFNWSTGATSAEITDLAEGTYSVTVTDNSCPNIVVGNIAMAQPNGIDIEDYNENDISCHNGTNGSISVSITGGSGEYTYAWAGTAQTTATIENLTAGTYNLTCTDANCTNNSVTQTFVLDEPGATIINNIAVTNASAGKNNGKIVVSASGDASVELRYALNTGSYQSSATFSNLAAGTYQVKVSDQNSCGPVTSQGTVQTATAVDYPSEGSLQLYPNPAIDFVNVALPNGFQKPENIMVYGMNGKKVDVNNIVLNDNTLIIDISNLTTGSYLINTDGFVLQFIKELR
ncbi:MAG: T9SS type A sorting domain-containing protein [Bacteroidales bacterium]|nr:T9SS type A sorting domain-containing protein [Bacteroidales bacterium]